MHTPNLLRIGGPAAPAFLLGLVLGLSAPCMAEDPNDLDAQARQLAQTQIQRFGKGYEAKLDPSRRLVFVTALDEEHFRRTAGLLAAFADAFRKTLSTAEPGWNIAVVLPTDDDYKPLAPAKEVLGFYRSDQHVLISIDRSRVLLHEFTHALCHADLAQSTRAPAIWITEGLATLFEATEIDPDGLRPVVDARLLTVQKAMREKNLIDLARLMDLGPEPFQKDGLLCYAQSRYLMLYLYDQKLLAAWYKEFRSHLEDDPTGVKALEKVCGKRLYRIEDDWKDWLAKLKLPWGELRSGQARLGAEVQDDPLGAKVVSFTAGSAAERAGRLKVGDIIVKFNGRAIPNAGEFIAAVRGTGSARTVNIDLLRDGRQVTIQQPLGGGQIKETP
jgi:hypothetical protein